MIRLYKNTLFFCLQVKIAVKRKKKEKNVSSKNLMGKSSKSSHKPTNRKKIHNRLSLGTYILEITLVILFSLAKK